MRRKAGAGRPPPEIGLPTPAKALQTAIAQSAQEIAALSVNAEAAEAERVTLPKLCEGLPEAALFALIEGPGGGFGLLTLDTQAVAALIEIQTTGRVAPRAAEPRPPTRTDAIMCADFIDRILELFESRVEEHGIEFAPALIGYRYAMPLTEVRAIPMTLEDVPFRRFQVDLDIGDGAKAGQLQLVLPFEPSGYRASGAGSEGGAFSVALQAQVMEAQAVLRTALHRQRMTLADLAALRPGALVEVPRAALGEICVEDISGNTVARGRLGQTGGSRAIRLVETEAAAPVASGLDRAPAPRLENAQPTHARPVDEGASAVEPAPMG